jgi:hypothetical protein
MAMRLGIGLTLNEKFRGSDCEGDVSSAVICRLR